MARLRQGRARWRRGQVLQHLVELLDVARRLEAEYRDDATAAVVLAPRVVPALEGLAADVGRTAQSLSRRIAHLGGALPPTPPRTPRAAETMWGYLGPALELERDLITLAADWRARLEEWDPTTAELTEQVRKDAAARERQLVDLVARL